jgi:hypothetical protein
MNCKRVVVTSLFFVEGGRRRPQTLLLDSGNKLEGEFYACDFWMPEKGFSDGGTDGSTIFATGDRFIYASFFGDWQ